MENLPTYKYSDVKGNAMQPKEPNAHDIYPRKHTELLSSHSTPAPEHQGQQKKDKTSAQIIRNGLMRF